MFINDLFNSKRKKKYTQREPPSLKNKLDYMTVRLIFNTFAPRIGPFVENVGISKNTYS